MIIPADRLLELFLAVKEDTTKSEQKTLNIFVANGDVDSVCSSAQLEVRSSRVRCQAKVSAKQPPRDAVRTQPSAVPPERPALLRTARINLAVFEAASAEQQLSQATEAGLRAQRQQGAPQTVTRSLRGLACVLQSILARAGDIPSAIYPVEDFSKMEALCQAQGLTEGEV